MEFASLQPGSVHRPGVSVVPPANPDSLLRKLAPRDCRIPGGRADAAGQRHAIDPHPVKGSADAGMALMGGQVDFLFDGPTTALANARAGKLKMLVLTDSKP